MGPVTRARGKRGAWAGSLVALVLLLVLGAAAPALAAPRDLDLSFGDEGVATTRCIDDSGEWLHDCSTLDVAIQPDGKIITGGVSSLSRLNSNGSLDASFGSGGIVGDLASDAAAFALALQPDAKIVTVGYVSESLPSGGSNHDVQLKRYNADGSLDTSFDGDGKLATAVGPADAFDNANAVVIQPDGKILVAGGSVDPSNGRGDFALLRYNADGSLDTSFDGDGKLTTDFASGEEGANELVLQDDGKIVAGGSSGHPDPSGEITDNDFALARYNADGSLDTSFGTGGKLTTAVGTSYDWAAGLAVQPEDDKIVVAGTSRNGTNEPNDDFALLRYNADGSLDDSFSDDGMLTTDIGSKGNSLSDMALQPNGKIVVAGQAADPNGSRGYETNLALARYNPNGTLDTDFGGDGTFTNSLSPSTDFATSLALRPDSKIVTAGQATNERGVADRFVTRHCGDGCRPTGPVTGFSATGYGDHIDLAWTNPTDADYATTRIYRSDSGFATSAQPATDQTQIYEGRGTSFEDVPSADGTYYYTAFARANNGTWTAAATASAKARLLPAYANITSTSGPAHYNTLASRSASFEFTSSEEGASLQCSLDDGPFETCTSPKEYTGLADSVRPDGSAGTIPPHVFRVRAVIDGNIGPADTRYWYVDATAPTVEIDYGPHGAVNTGYYNKTDAGFFWNVRDPNWRRDECSLDGAPFGTCPGNDRYQSFYRNLTDGEHTFRVRSIDSVDNVGEDSSSWVVDTQVPKTSIDGGPTGTVSAGTARFELSSAGGSPVTFRCRLDGAAFAACGSSQNYTDLANGEHTFSVQATDRAGNVGPVESQTWTVAPDRANEEVEAGGTLTTDADGEAGASPSDPLETTITSPVAGTVSIVESAGTGPAPVGYSFLGQQANITAPASTPEDPLRFVFRLDPSLLPAGTDHNSIEVFRNGAMVETCADPSGTVASPNPCVLGREVLVDGGDIEVTILTAAASYWNLGVVDTVAPRVKSVTPADLSKNASAGASVTATFSEAMKASTIKTDSFVLVKRGTATPVPAKVSYAATAKKATLNPKRDLKPGTTYTATIKRGATDAAGNALADDKVWTFTVKKR